MKVFLASITLALLFALGSVSAGESTQKSDGNCGHYDKFKDT